MKNYIMMVGRLNAKNEGFRLLNVETKKVIDLTEDEIIKLLQAEEIELLNLKVDENGKLVCPHDINKYGIVGKSNAFVVVSKKIIDASIVDGVSFEVADVNGLVKNYYQSEAVNLCDFYQFANVRADVGENSIKCLSNSRIYYLSKLNKDERIAKAREFVKELQSSNIKVMCHEIPYNNSSPTKYALNMLGRIGRIDIISSRENFNKDIIEKLKFDGVSISGNCKSVHPMYGNTETFYGWTTNSSAVPKLPNCEFTIKAISYCNDTFLNDGKHTTYDYKYSVYIKSIGAYVYILENNKIGKIELEKFN